MSNAIGNAITDDNGNSLSPEPCALIPAVAKEVCGVTHYGQIQSHRYLGSPEIGFGTKR